MNDDVKVKGLIFDLAICEACGRQLLLLAVRWGGFVSGSVRPKNPSSCR